MVRKASRLAPGQQSVEEVLLNRLVNNRENVAATRALPQSSFSTHRSLVSAAPKHVSINDRERASVLASPAPAAPGSPTPLMSLELMQQISNEIATLDQRLQLVAMGLSTTASYGLEGQAIRSMSDECNVHQSKIEKFLQKSIQEVSKAHQGGEGQAKRSTVLDPASSAQMTHSVRDIRSTIRRLDKVFHKVASGDKQRYLAATKISMMCRGFIVRRRYRKLWLALGSWRARKCAHFVVLMEQFTAHEAFASEQVALMREERNRLLLRRVLAEFRGVVLTKLPLRMARLEESEQRFHKKLRNLLKCVFLPWKMMALGPRSRKRVIAEARARHYAARQRLEALERFDLITQKMVHEEFLKDNIRQIRARHPTHVLRRYFRVMKSVEFLPLKSKMQSAAAHAARKTLKRVLNEWMQVLRAKKSTEAVGDRRTLKRYDQHFNLRKINAHYQRTHKLKHFRAWFAYCQLVRRVRRLFAGNTKETLIWLLKRWHVRAQYQRALRGNAVEEWLAYSRRIHVIPFRCWYVFMARRRAARLAKESICVAYERRQRRHTKYIFFRLWMHQVLFGHIEGLHSKVYLLHCLEDQKRMCLGLEANAALYRDNIAALHASIAQLEDKLMEKQQELVRLHETTQTARFGVHKAEQSIAQIQGMLEAVRTVHPGTVERIETMYRDNPLLSKELKDVIMLHAKKRRELLSKIELDQTELEVQNASKGVGTQEDQMLLHRVKWVLSRLDLGMHDQDGSNQHDTRRTSGNHTMKQLCALFEFIRNGDTALLVPVNNPEYQEQTQTSRYTNLMAPGTDSNDQKVCRADVLDGSSTWYSFLQSLTVKFVPEKLMSVKERLVLRAAERDAEVAESKANLHAYHLYK